MTGSCEARGTTGSEETAGSEEPAEASTARAELLASAIATVVRARGRYLAVHAGAAPAIKRETGIEWDFLTLDDAACAAGPCDGAVIAADLRGDGDLSDAESRWAASLGAAELAHAINAHGIRQDTLLASRAAEVLATDWSWCTSVMRLRHILAGLADEWRFERPNLSVAWVLRAVRAAHAGDALTAALDVVGDAVAIGGTIAVVVAQVPN